MTRRSKPVATSKAKPSPKPRATSRNAKPKSSRSTDPFAAFEAACLALPKAKRAEWANGKRITDRVSFRIDDSEYREFAAWVPSGPQAGGHVRYGDAKRLDDPRFETSKAFRGTHNWMYVKAGSDWAPLLEDSYRVAGQRGGGLTVAPTFYKPLACGLALVRERDRPTRLHAGGPALKIVSNEGPAAFKLALWSAREVSDTVVPAEAAALGNALTALAQADELRDRLIATLPDREVRMGSGYKQLANMASELPTLEAASDPMRAVAAAIDAFRCLPGGYNERAIAACGVAVEATVRALQAARRDAAAYLTELDRRAQLHELYAVAKAHDLALPEVERVLWRGADDKGYPAFWLFAAGGELGLVCKLGRRWQLTVGTRDDVLATIPDTHFAAAVDYIS